MHDDTTDIDDRPLLRTVRVELRADGSNYVQPGRPLDTLRAIAALVKRLPHSDYLGVSLGSYTREGHALLVEHGAKTRTLTTERGDDMTYATLELDGVTFTACFVVPR